MAVYDSKASGAVQLPPTWIRLLLGVVLVAGGLLVLGDVALATLVSTLFIGVVAVIVGVFEILHAFWTKGWGGFLWQILLGALYVAFGWRMLSEPASGALLLTYFLGLVFLASGIIRVFIGFRRWSETGWIMLLSGAFGILAGVVVISGLPASGIWLLGLLLGIDLLWHGIAWLSYGWMPSSAS